MIRDKFTKINPIYQTLFKTKYNIYSNDKQKFSLTEIKEYKIEIKQKGSNLSFSFPLKINAIAKIKIQVMDNKKNAYKGTWNSQINKQKFLNLKNTNTITKDLFTNENKLTSLTIRKGKLPTKKFESEDSLFGQNGLTKLTNLTLANITWTSIPYRCFGSVNNVVNLDLSGCWNLKTIDNCSFEYCQTMTKILFPKSLESIDRHAFYKANKLTNLNLSNTSIKTLGEKTKEYPFGKDNKIENLNLENCSKITTINNYAFANANLTTLDLSSLKNLTTIGNSAFQNSHLTTLDLSNLNNLTRIGNSAFANAKLTIFKTSNLINLKNIGSSAFHESHLDLKFLEKFTALETIGSAAFSHSLWSGRLDLTKCNLKHLYGNFSLGEYSNKSQSIKIFNKWKNIGDWNYVFFCYVYRGIHKIDKTYSYVQ